MARYTLVIRDQLSFLPPYIGDRLDVLAEAMMHQALEDAAYPTNRGWRLVGTVDYQRDAVRWFVSPGGWKCWQGIGGQWESYTRACAELRRRLRRRVHIGQAGQWKRPG